MDAELQAMVEARKISANDSERVLAHRGARVVVARQQPKWIRVAEVVSEHANRAVPAAG